jgi:hypothetical protein
MTSIFIRDKPIFSSERVLHKDYDRKCSVERKKKEFLVVSLKGLGAKKNRLSVTTSSKVILTLTLRVNGLVSWDSTVVGPSPTGKNVRKKAQDIVGIHHRATTCEDTTDFYRHFTYYLQPRLTLVSSVKHIFNKSSPLSCMHAILLMKICLQYLQMSGIWSFQDYDYSDHDVLEWDAV